MKKGLIHFGMAAVLSCLLIVSPADANSDKVRLKTAVVETMLVPESGEALSWERSFPETMFMPRDIERAGVRGCGIFSFNIGKDGKAKDIETEAAVPRFGLSRLARDYIKLWRWEAKPSGGIEEQVLLRLDFCIAGATEDEVQQFCAYQATLPCKDNPR